MDGSTLDTLEDKVRLTAYSHGAGCGCKISPSVLTRMLGALPPATPDARLLVGFGGRDDAAVYALDDEPNGQVLVSTTDFFMPIVDDPADFGAIAAANAISDVYAMGARPVIALAILGWPLDRLAPEIAGDVLRGAAEACARAGIALAGGHSIDAPEPIFGLAVTGTAHRRAIRTNSQARAGCELYLTKPLGVGVMATAQKRGVLEPGDFAAVRDSMLALNEAGPAFATLDAVATMTDVTGFGLLGHLLEVCDASSVSADLRWADIPRFSGIAHYLALDTVPGGTARNWTSYGDRVGALSDVQRTVLSDPQTSGGLLVVVDPRGRDDFLTLARAHGLDLISFGTLGAARVDGGPAVRVS